MNKYVEAGIKVVVAGGMIYSGLRAFSPSPAGATGSDECPYPPQTVLKGQTIWGLVHEKNDPRLKSDYVVAINDIEPTRLPIGFRLKFCGENTGGTGISWWRLPKTGELPKPIEQPTIVLPDGLSPDQARKFPTLVSDPQQHRIVTVPFGWSRIETGEVAWDIKMDIANAKDVTAETYSVDQLGELRADGRGQGGVKPKGVFNSTNGDKRFVEDGHVNIALSTTAGAGGEKGGMDWFIYLSSSQSQPDPSKNVSVDLWSQLR